MIKYTRLPKHIGIIPDGNRRWALEHGMANKDGYAHGIDPGIDLYQQCRALGIKELTFYGFTVDNTKRPAEQKEAFQQACVDAVLAMVDYDVELFVVGNTQSPSFPQSLLPYANKPVVFGSGGTRVNFLVNYGWSWDLNYFWKQKRFAGEMSYENMIHHIASKDISRIDLIIRWGGRRRLSGFLPVQSIYADFYVLDEYWPDYQPEHLQQALDWYQQQDVTLGG